MDRRDRLALFAFFVFCVTLVEAKWLYDNWNSQFCMNVTVHTITQSTYDGPWEQHPELKNYSRRRINVNMHVIAYIGDRIIDVKVPFTKKPWGWAETRTTAIPTHTSMAVPIPEVRLDEPVEPTLAR